MVVEEVLEVYDGGVHASRVTGEGCDCRVGVWLLEYCVVLGFWYMCSGVVVGGGGVECRCGCSVWLELGVWVVCLGWDGGMGGWEMGGIWPCLDTWCPCLTL